MKRGVYRVRSAVLPFATRVFRALPRPLQRFGAGYADLSMKYPHAVASSTAGFNLFVADVTAQAIVGEPGEAWDSRRTLALTTFGLLYYGGVNKYMYLCFDRFLPGRPMFTAFIDVWVHGPFIFMPSFYWLTGTVKGQSQSNIWALLQKEWLVASTGSAIYWTPVQMFCFACVPQHSRIPYVTFCSFFQKTWLSWLSNRERVAEQKRVAAPMVPTVDQTP